MKYRSWAFALTRPWSLRPELSRLIRRGFLRTRRCHRIEGFHTENILPETHYKLMNIATWTKLHYFHEPPQHLARMHLRWQLSRRWRLPLWTPRCSPRSASSSGIWRRPRPLHRETRREQRPRGWRGRQPLRCRVSGSCSRRGRIYSGEFWSRKFQSLHCLHFMWFDIWQLTSNLSNRILDRKHHQHDLNFIHWKHVDWSFNKNIRNQHFP